MILGVDYYPEQWPESRWADDARMMRELGLELVRIGEFAWAKMEPEEGRFEFDWLHRAINVLAKAGLRVILGTPTAAPPAWLSRRYPDTLPVEAHGRRRNFGGRRQYCPNSAKYQEFAKIIVTELAQRYGHDRRVTGWQIDNEFGDEKSARCYCEHCQGAFRDWLKSVYGSLDQLNEAWGTNFWSQTYIDWEQIGLPNLTGTDPNPSHKLDFYRFNTISFARFQHIQIEVIKKLADREKQFVTHNFMGLFSELNAFELAKELDFVSWDNYPTGQQDRLKSLLYGEDQPDVEYAYDVGDPLITGMAHDLMRGVKQKPFWVMEQQPGPINWGTYNQGVRAGTVRLWTWHAAAHGANHIVYFRWRASLNGQEQYHAGLLNHDASPGVGYRDIQSLIPERDLLKELADHPIEPAQVAIVFDYNDLWALEIQPQRKGFCYLGYFFLFYRALMRLGIPVDIIPPNADLSSYRLVITPSAHLGQANLANALMNYTTDGGNVLMGIRSGFKTHTNRVNAHPLPGMYRRLVGAVVNEWHGLTPNQPYIISSDIKDLAGPVRIWAEALDPDPGTQALAKYQSGPFRGQAAIVQHRLGTGKAYYLGFYPYLHQMMALMVKLSNDLGIDRLGDLPPGMVAQRRGDLILLFNFTDQTMTAVIGGAQVSLPPREVHVRQRVRPFVLKTGYTRPLG